MWGQRHRHIDPRGVEFRAGGFEIDYWRAKLGVVLRLKKKNSRVSELINTSAKQKSTYTVLLRICLVPAAPWAAATAA